MAICWKIYCTLFGVKFYRAVPQYPSIIGLSLNTPQKNNVKILGFLSQAIELEYESTRVLDNSLGRVSDSGDMTPRMGDG